MAVAIMSNAWEFAARNKRFLAQKVSGGGSLIDKTFLDATIKEQLVAAWGNFQLAPATVRV